MKSSLIWKKRPFPTDAGYMKCFPFMLSMDECTSETKEQSYIQRSLELEGSDIRSNLLILWRRKLEAQRNKWANQKSLDGSLIDINRRNIGPGELKLLSLCGT